jgi:cytochrome P450
MLLDDPAYTVPDPGPPGPYGTMAWLRATVPRFCEGAAHARRRALVESLLPEPAALRDAARERQHVNAMREQVDARADITVAGRASAHGASDVAEVVTATRVIAAAYHPHTSHTDADTALARLLTLLPAGDPEVVAARVCILVQACEATAALVRGEDVPVPVTRRVDQDGRTVLIDLSDCPFGAGPRRCPGEAHARALVEGLT